MSQDVATVVESARKAVQAAHNDFRALYAATDSSLMPSSLLVAGSDLDKLSINLGVLAISANTLPSDLLSDLFKIHVSEDVTLSHAIVRDMHAIAGHLRSMKPSLSSKALMTMEKRHCQDVSDIVRRYDRIISAMLDHHHM
jgi:hypothetical protein